MKEEKPIGYIYIKNGKIMGNDKTGKNKSFGKAIPVYHIGYYRIENGKLFLITSDKDLKPGDVFVGDRNRKEYREKRQEATGGEKPEDTRVHDELKEETNENPTPENHSESEE